MKNLLFGVLVVLAFAVPSQAGVVRYAAKKVAHVVKPVVKPVAKAAVKVAKAAV